MAMTQRVDRICPACGELGHGANQCWPLAPTPPPPSPPPTIPNRPPYPPAPNSARILRHGMQPARLLYPWRWRQIILAVLAAN